MRWWETGTEVPREHKHTHTHTHRARQQCKHIGGGGGSQPPDALTLLGELHKVHHCRPVFACREGEQRAGDTGDKRASMSEAEPLLIAAPCRATTSTHLLLSTGPLAPASLPPFLSEKSKRPLLTFVMELLRLVEQLDPRVPLGDEHAQEVRGVGAVGLNVVKARLGHERQAVTRPPVPCLKGILLRRQGEGGGGGGCRCRSQAMGALTA